eukprot:Skav234319  [mRNA]  locus=scaffold3847:36485:36706:+ [translate_table: standard]
MAAAWPVFSSPWGRCLSAAAASCWALAPPSEAKMGTSVGSTASPAATTATTATRKGEVDGVEEGDENGDEWWA